MSHRQRTPIALVFTLLLIAGCASAGGPGDADGGPDGAFATVVIENDNPRIVNVSALRSGTRYRVGTVPPLSTRELEIRRYMTDSTGELQLLIAPLGSGHAYRAQPILVSEGDVIELRVSSLVR